jgi:hypothetical protein
MEVGGDAQEEVVLAFLLVLQKQVKKEKDTQEANQRTACLSTGVPKANNLKRAFRKLETLGNISKVGIKLPYSRLWACLDDAAAVSGFDQLWR